MACQLVFLTGARAGSGVRFTQPAFWIGRDPRVLQRLAKATGLHLLTNTGYYGGADDKYVPAHACTESVAQLAERWVQAWTAGIEDTGVKPGFIKTGVDEIAEGTALSAIDEKLVRASALASQRTGLTVVCHTGGGAAGLAALQTFLREQGFSPFRVRYHETVARIEVADRDLPRLIAQPLRDQVIARFKSSGFTYVALDLQGFRSGSMNEGTRP